MKEIISKEQYKQLKIIKKKVDKYIEDYEKMTRKLKGKGAREDLVEIMEKIQKLLLEIENIKEYKLKQFVQASPELLDRADQGINKKNMAIRKLELQIPNLRKLVEEEAKKNPTKPPPKASASRWDEEPFLKKY